MVMNSNQQTKTDKGPKELSSSSQITAVASNQSSICHNDEEAKFPKTSDNSHVVKGNTSTISDHQNAHTEQIEFQVSHKNLANSANSSLPNSFLKNSIEGSAKPVESCCLPAGDSILQISKKPSDGPSYDNVKAEENLIHDK
jgi:hypothetical protein